MIARPVDSFPNFARAFFRVNRVNRVTQGDSVLLFLLVLLTFLSCTVLYSASGQDLGLVLRQLARFGIGFILMFLLMQVPINTYRWWAPWAYVVSVLLLLAVLFFGEVVNGARRWIDLAFIRFQPSEVFRIVLPLMVCYLIARESVHSQAWKFILAIPVIVAPVILVILQPDFGTALLIGIAGFLPLFLAGIHWGWLLGATAGLVGASPFIWHAMLDYQRQRLLAFLNPESDPFGAGYHIIQSKIAIGSGGIWGKGWLDGSQSQLDFLPERATDFIFATFAEEFGFVGVAVLFVLYLVILLRSVGIALNAGSEFERLLAAGLVLSLFVYFVVNIGMVSGLIPVVGAPLPLMSYGGTSIVISLAVFGMLMAISQHKPLMKDQPTDIEPV